MSCSYKEFFRLVQYCHNMYQNFPECPLLHIVSNGTDTLVAIPGYPVLSWDAPRWQVGLDTPIFEYLVSQDT